MCSHAVYVVVNDVKMKQQAALILVCMDVSEKPVFTLKGMMAAAGSCR
jgi:glycerol kinase